MGDSKLRLYTKYQAFEEPEAYERTIHVLLKEARRYLQTRNLSRIDAYKNGFQITIGIWLDTIGQNVWIAKQILDNWSTTPRRTVFIGDGIVKFQAQILTSDGPIYVTLPIYYDATRPFDVEVETKSKLNEMFELNLRRIEHARKIEALAVATSDLTDMNEIERLRAEMFLLFTQRPRSKFTAR